MSKLGATLNSSESMSRRSCFKEQKRTLLKSLNSDVDQKLTKELRLRMELKLKDSLWWRLCETLSRFSRVFHGTGLYGH